MNRPRLALVPGEPTGIGPELCVRAAQRIWDADLIAFADRDCLLRAAKTASLPLEITAKDSASKPGFLPLVDCPHPVTPIPGIPNTGNSHSVIHALESAALGCLRGDFDGLVTGPIHKATINSGGIAYTGTTELLANQAGCQVVMMLCNDHMRIALATTHLPLRSVPDAINATKLQHILHIIQNTLRYAFDIASPHIAVLGLNPHAGEEGYLGREEIDYIIPAINTLRQQGMILSGPLPADTAFLPDTVKKFDAVLAMYHDQGLPVLKQNGFTHTVNLTLGLPYPRVAVDHGTALHLAGQNCANPQSLFSAIQVCIQLTQRRHNKAYKRAYKAH